MAAGGPIRELREELTCPICLEYFSDPATIAECGHNFCRGCLALSWGEAEAGASCPLCKQPFQPRNLRPNRQLANVVEIAKKLSPQGGAAQERVCEKHWKPLKFFCRNDQALVCVLCDRSKEHKNHEVIPAEEASEEYKGKISSCLETLRTEKERIRAYIADAEDESQEMLKITESERQKTVAEFRRLRQLLKEQEDRLLAEIEQVEKEIASKRDEHLARLSEELSSLESLMCEMEEMQQQPASELLQDVRSTLQRYEKKEKFENPVALTPELEWKLRGCCDIGPFLGGVMKQFQGTLSSVLRMQKANVTLDPASVSTPAGSKLVLSEDQKTVRCQSKTEGLPEDPKEFYRCSYLLGCERFTAGCHFWEASVGSEEGWAVGVARKYRKGPITMTPEEGIWAVGRWKDQYKAFIKGTDSPLCLSGELKRIRVCLNYDTRQVAFFDADRAALLYAFSGASFSGDAISPFFAVYGKGYLRISP